MPAPAADPAEGFKPLRATLVFGAIYDLLFAALMVVAPQVLSSTFHLPLPGERFYLWLIALLLAMLALCYLAAARDPRRLRAIVGVAIVGRFAGFVLFAISAWGRPDLSGLWGVAIGDLVLSLAHLGTAGKLRD